MNIALFGATKFSAKCLAALLELPFIKVCGILTVPPKFNISYSKDKPITNVNHADFTDICNQNSIPLIELKGKMNDAQLIQIIDNWNPDLILAAGWYHMVPETILRIPPKGVVGLHASLLPHYRGNAPLTWAIINGEPEVGVSLFYFEREVDAGDIIGQKNISVNFNDDIDSLYKKVETIGTELLKEMLVLIEQNRAPRTKQIFLLEDTSKFYRARSPEDGKIDWSLSAFQIYNFIRAQTKPYPGAFTFYQKKPLVIWEGKLYDWIPQTGSPGQIIAIIEAGPLQGILIATVNNDCPLLLTRINYDGIDLTGIEWFKAYRIKIGEVLGI